MPERVRTAAVAWPSALVKTEKRESAWAGAFLDSDLDMLDFDWNDPVDFGGARAVLGNFEFSATISLREPRLRVSVMFISMI